MVRAIAKTFDELKRRGKKGLIPFITAGDPDLETTVRLVPELARAGADIVELGIPFSDPVADGPTIQRASERALRHGYALADFLEAARSIRLQSEVPLVLFSYFNPILQCGVERLAGAARAAGIDGILVTDITPEEGRSYCDTLGRNEIDPIFLVAPTSDAARVRRIVDCCRGFVYVVSRTGVTGARDSVSAAAAPAVERVRAVTDLPIAVGFGISSPEQVRAVWQVADAAVVGSAIVARMEEHAGAPDLVARIAAYCRTLSQ
jgi:tryptophan synthase alpha chain